eukprot:scaffold38337_cov21-Tisochrysis_lutea.AAC.1
MSLPSPLPPQLEPHACVSLNFTAQVYLPEVLSFEVCLPSPPSKPVSPATTAGLASPRATQPEPLVTPALHHPAPVGPYV